MIEAARATQQASQSVDIRLPVTFSYGIGGIVGRVMLGLGSLVAAAGLSYLSGLLWIIAAIGFALFGGIVSISNLWALMDRSRRTITLSEEGVEIRYGMSRRIYRLVDYAEFRIAKLGLRRFLTALPLEPEPPLGGHAPGKRISARLKPAIISPMPPFGDGAPASLPEWQALLNELRGSALSAARQDGAVRLVRNTAGEGIKRSMD